MSCGTEWTSCSGNGAGDPWYPWKGWRMSLTVWDFVVAVWLEIIPGWNSSAGIQVLSPPKVHLWSCPWPGAQGVFNPREQWERCVGMESYCSRHLRPWIFIAFCATSLQHGKGTEIVYFGSILELKLSQKPKKRQLYWILQYSGHGLKVCNVPFSF